MSEIVIGSRVTSLGYGTFDGCLNLKAINVSEDNKSYSSYDGVLYNKDKTILIRCPQGKKEIVRIQVTVRVIDDDAFKGCSKVEFTIGVEDNSATEYRNIGGYMYGCAYVHKKEFPITFANILNAITKNKGFGR